MRSPLAPLFPPCSCARANRLAARSLDNRIGFLLSRIDGVSTLETLLSIKRAGADLILTYHALEAAALLKKG